MSFSATIYLFLALLVAACSKESPAPITDGVTTFSLDLKYPNDHYLPYSRSELPQLRAVVEVYQHNTSNLVMRRYFEADETKELILSTGDYTINIWSDYTLDKRQDLYYRCTSTESIRVAARESYATAGEWKDSFVGSTRVYCNGSQESVELEIPLRRPVARYEIVATDVAEYLARNSAVPLSDLVVEISYTGYFPTAYNITKGVLCGAEMGYSYTTTPSDAESESVTLAMDHVMVGANGSSLYLNIYIRGGDGELISRVLGVEVAYRAGEVTMVSGEFLTAGKGGVNVDTDWGSDFDYRF